MHPWLTAACTCLSIYLWLNPPESRSMFWLWKSCAYDRSPGAHAHMILWAARGLLDSHETREPRSANIFKAMW